VTLCHRRDRGAVFKRLFDDPPLGIYTPPSSTARLHYLQTSNAPEPVIDNIIHAAENATFC
jgi:hypothetical protein